MTDSTSLTNTVYWEDCIRTAVRLVEHQHELHSAYDTLKHAKRHICSILDASQYQWPDYQNIPRHSVKDKLSWSVAGQLLHTKQLKLPSELENQRLISHASQSRPSHWDSHRNDRHRSPGREHGYYRPHTRARHRTRSPSPHKDEYYRPHSRDRHRTRSPSPRRENYYRQRTEEPRYSYHARLPLLRVDREADRMAASRRYLQERSGSPPTLRHPPGSTSDRSAPKYAPTAHHSEAASQSRSRQFYQNAVAKDAYQDHAIQDGDDLNYETGAVDDGLTEQSGVELEFNSESNTASDLLRLLQMSVLSPVNCISITVNNHHLIIDVTQGAIQASTLLNVQFGRKPPRDASSWRLHQQALYEVSYQAGKGKPYSKLSSKFNVKAIVNVHQW